MLILQARGLSAEKDQSHFLPLMLAVPSSKGNAGVDMTSISVFGVILLHSLLLRTELFFVSIY